MNRLSPLLFAILLFLVPSGCQSAAERELAQARDNFNRFFAALSERDCRALPKLATGRMWTEHCESAALEFHHHLMRVLEIERDGRDAKRILVRALTRTRKAERERLFVMKQVDGVWKVAFDE